jgi:hypothetical protein
VPIYRLAAPGDHLYALYATEGVGSGYTPEGIAFYLSQSSYGNVTTPLYRCNAGFHFLSSDPNCEGHTTEGRLGWISQVAQPGGEQLFRCTSLHSNDHLTTSSAECAAAGYWVEGPQGYSVGGSPPPPPNCPVGSIFNNGLQRCEGLVPVLRYPYLTTYGPHYPRVNVMGFELSITPIPFAYLYPPPATAFLALPPVPAQQASADSRFVQFYKLSTPDTEAIGGTYFYCARAECDQAILALGYHDGPAAFRIFASPEVLIGSLPLYRMYNAPANFHVYTVHPDELLVTQNHFVVEGVVGYVFPSP